LYDSSSHTFYMPWQSRPPWLVSGLRGRSKVTAKTREQNRLAVRYKQKDLEVILKWPPCSQTDLAPVGKSGWRSELFYTKIGLSVSQWRSKATAVLDPIVLNPSMFVRIFLCYFVAKRQLSSGARIFHPRSQPSVCRINDFMINFESKWVRASCLISTVGLCCGEVVSQFSLLKHSSDSGLFMCTCVVHWSRVHKCCSWIAQP
jgi:hypothetical protein